MKRNNLTFIFWGTPDVASETLNMLKMNGYIPSLIITAPDKPKGRKNIMTPPEVKKWAITNNILYLQPEKLDEDFYNKLKIKNYDLSIVVAYGKIIPKNIIDLPKSGSLNIHYSLLPKYRGASPVESAILDGENESGITIQKMEYKMDSGPILIQKKIDIKKNEKAIDLRKRMIKIGAELLIEVLPLYLEGKVKEKIQNEEEATFCKKIKKEDGLIDLNYNPELNLRKIRAYAGWPGTYFFFENKYSKKIRIIIKDAEIIDNKLCFIRVIPEGKNEMGWDEFLRGQNK